MKFETKTPTMDTSMHLGNMPSGDVFHFDTLSFQQALKEDAFYMVIQGGKEGRVKVVCLIDGLVQEFDKTHRVQSQTVTMVFDDYSNVSLIKKSHLWGIETINGVVTWM